jgi:hypothetical protein
MKTTYINWKNNSTINDLILAEVQSTPTNLTSAFSRAAAKINVSQGAVSQHWYKKMRKNIKGFSINSKASKSNNVKNDVRKVKSSKINDLSNPIHETIVSTKKLDGMRVVTIKKYFID